MKHNKLNQENLLFLSPVFCKIKLELDSPTSFWEERETVLTLADYNQDYLWVQIRLGAPVHLHPIFHLSPLFSSLDKKGYQTF
ncbi:hypothetical protein [Streptococcus sobrinus]|uniref:hypothetical protein n=1 Tax=Streptococcus sobrinus TaxID=1310 RepID=UPI0003811EFA|nr:hypothetical protein [Streptococcus sobrinus]